MSFQAGPSSMAMSKPSRSSQYDDNSKIGKKTPESLKQKSSMQGLMKQ